MDLTDKAEDLVVLPSGKKFKRKTYTEYTENELKDIISQCSNISHILSTLKLNNVYHYKIKEFIDKNKLSTSHFKLIQKNQYHYTPSNGKTIRSHSKFKGSLLREGKLVNKCAICNLNPEWNNKPLTLQLDHINGDHSNNNLDNLRLLCPNCHSQTDTYTGRNNKQEIQKRRPCSECKINRITEKNKNGICVPCRRKIEKSKSIENKIEKEVIKNKLESNDLKLPDKLYPLKKEEKLPKIIIEKIKPILKCKKCSIEISKKSKTGHCRKCKRKGIKIEESIPKPKLKCSICQIEISNKSKTGCCPKCAHKNSRKVERPSYEILIKEINELGYLQVGNKYGVSDNAIRKWVKNYQNKPTKPITKQSPTSY
jgi:Zn finger protein HypA/HybF involved in hydrogenase expression